MAYLEKHGMIRTKSPVEVYAREINKEHPLSLFLKVNLYGFGYKENSRLYEALYFAPHFGQAIAKNHPGVQIGVSYIARIQHIEVVETWSELENAIKEQRGKPWWNSHNDFVRPIRKQWKWPGKRSLLSLDTPRMVFNPPIRKEHLQKGTGCES
jgi:hypothetical protein